MYHVCESYPTVCISTESSLLERRGEEWGMSERIEIIDWFKVYVQYEKVAANARTSFWKREDFLCWRLRDIKAQHTFFNRKWRITPFTCGNFTKLLQFWFTNIKPAINLFTKIQLNLITKNKHDYDNHRRHL